MTDKQKELLEKARVLAFAAHGWPVYFWPNVFMHERKWDAKEDSADELLRAGYVRVELPPLPYGYRLVAFGEAVRGNCMMIRPEYKNRQWTHYLFTVCDTGFDDCTAFMAAREEPARHPLTPDDLQERALSGKTMYYTYEDRDGPKTKLIQTIHDPITGKNLLKKKAHWIDGTPCWKGEVRDE